MSADHRPNPLERLKLDIRALAERERKWPILVQVPRNRALDLVGMNAQKWAEGARGLLTEDEIDDILERTFKEGPSALTGLHVGTIRIKVADRMEDDCDELTILESRPLGE